MINPVGIAIGLSLYLSLMNISLAASYDVNPIADKSMVALLSSHKTTLAFNESILGVENTTPTDPVITNQSKPNSHLLIAFITLGFCYLTAFRRRKAKQSIFF